MLLLNLNSSISLSLLFSFITMCGTIVAICGVYKSHLKEGNERNLDIEKNFVKINMKLDEFCRELSDLVKKSDTSSNTLIEIQKTIISIKAIIENHQKILDDHEDRLTNIEKSLLDRRND